MRAPRKPEHGETSPVVWVARSENTSERSKQVTTHTASRGRSTPCVSWSTHD
jgi:hypothetical protein